MTERPSQAVADGVEVFAPPSAEAIGLARRLSWLLAPGALGFLVVAPFTQFTFLSFELQTFLFQVFHTRLPARVGHAVFMPVVTFFVMVALAGLRFGPHPDVHGWAGPSLNGATVYAMALLAWYFCVARTERLYLWWALTAPSTLALAFGADAFHCHTFTLDAANRSFLAPAPLAANPFVWMAVAALMIMLSHVPEPRLPPRVADAWVWTGTLHFVLGPREARHAPARVARCALMLLLQVLSGTIDEWWRRPG